MSKANHPASEKSTIQVVKEISINERKLEIARDRGVTTDILLQHDLIDSTLLYNDSQLTKASKSQLIIELEGRYLDAHDYCYGGHESNTLKCSFVVDVMANLRKIPHKEFSTFGQLLTQFVTNFYSPFKSGRLNFVFDIYNDEPSVKDNERLRRKESTPINLSEIKDSTPLPKDLKTFWPSNSNKYLLEKLLYTTISTIKSNYPIVIGQLNQDDNNWQCLMSDGNSPFIPYMSTQPYLE